MELGMVGLGRMGASMTERLTRAGHRVVGYDPAPAARQRIEERGARSAASLEALVGALEPPRAVWLMVPSGDATEASIGALAGLLEAGDTLIDGGNSNYKDTLRHAALLAERELRMVDAGTSGGIWGLAEGYSLMIGGDPAVVERLRPIFEALAPGPDRGWGHGSVVRSWLLELTSAALAENPTLAGIAPWVADSGEGRWTVEEAIALDVPAPVITLALLERLRSRDDDSFSDRLLAALRNQFGGHAVKKE